MKAAESIRVGDTVRYKACDGTTLCDVTGYVKSRKGTKGKFTVEWSDGVTRKELLADLERVYTV